MELTVVGLDPGNLRLGLSCITYQSGVYHLNDALILQHPRNPQLTFTEYLNEGIHKLAEEWPEHLHRLKPNFIVAEIVPVGRLGSNSELNVAAITVCKTIAYLWGIDFYEMGANTIKKELTGDGRANKTKVRNAVWELFPKLKKEHEILKKEQKDKGEKVIGNPPDLYDAVAIAYVGINKFGGIIGKEEA